MEKYIYDESNGLWYELQGDYYIPCLTLPTEKENKPIGLWGQRHKRYLQECKKAVYITLLTSGRLNSYLADIDEQATASLDVENETLIQAALSRLIKDKTVLVIAHRMRTVSGADKVVVLSNGTVAEQGTPEKLMNTGKIYPHMVKLQMISQDWGI